MSEVRRANLGGVGSVGCNGDCHLEPESITLSSPRGRVHLKSLIL